jgi:hypothetical protein
MHDHAGAVVEEVRDVADRAHVRLDRLELPERHVGVRRVLAVDREQPRVVREAGADPLDARHLALELPQLALVGPMELEVAGHLREIREVLLAPVDRLGQPLVVRQLQPGPAPERTP